MSCVCPNCDRDGGECLYDQIESLEARLAEERRVRGIMHEALSDIEYFDCMDYGESDRTCFYAERKPMCPPCLAKAALWEVAKLEKK